MRDDVPEDDYGFQRWATPRGPMRDAVETDKRAVLDITADLLHTMEETLDQKRRLGHDYTFLDVMMGIHNAHMQILRSIAAPLPSQPARQAVFAAARRTFEIACREHEARHG